MEKNKPCKFYQTNSCTNPECRFGHFKEKAVLPKEPSFVKNKTGDKEDNKKRFNKP